MANLKLVEKQNDAEVSAELHDKFKNRRNRMFERQWMINLAFYVGTQYIDFNRITNQLTPLPRIRPHQVRLVVNKIQPAVQMAVGKMMKNMPSAEVTPPDGDEKKVNIAKIASKLLEYNNRRFDYEMKLQHLVEWAVITGTAFFKHTWNPDLGSPMKIDEDIVNEGDEDTTVCSPFEIAVDPLALDVDSAQWMMHYRLYSKEYVKRMWGVDVEETESSAQDMFGMMDMRFAGDMMMGGLYMPPKGVLVKEYWERPSDEYPEGRFIITAGDHVVVNVRNYLGTLPFVMFRWFNIPNSFWGKGIIEDMIPLQKNYNRRRSQIAENANLMANPAWLAPAGAFLRGKEPTNAPAQIIEYEQTAGVEPKPVSMPALPAQVYQDMTQSDQEMSEVSGQRQIGAGMLPPGVRAAAALALVNEMDQTLLTPVSRNFESSIRKSAKLRLTIIRLFYDNPRDVHIVGSNRSFAVEQFKGSDIDDDYDISIQSVSGLPQDKTARFEILQQLLQVGIIDQFKFLQMMELSDVDEVFEDLQGDINSAQWENDQMSKGKEQAVQSFENHKTHIYEHQKFMRTLAFKKLSPKIQHLFIMHVQAHEQYDAQNNGQPDVQSKPGAQPPGMPPGMPLGMPTQAQGNPMGAMGSYNPSSALQGGMSNVQDTLHVMQG